MVLHRQRRLLNRGMRLEFRDGGQGEGGREKERGCVESGRGRPSTGEPFLGGNMLWPADKVKVFFCGLN